MKNIILLTILTALLTSCYALKIGIAGAVMASLFSYITITIWMFYDLFLKKGDVKLSLRNYSIKLPIIKKIS